MANEVKLTIKITDEGSLSVVAKNAKKATKETEKLAASSDRARKSREKYNKGEKGVAGATANSTKAFSKMRESMTGGGGLVPAYATLAANVFAATAAFNLLRRASQVEQLTQGLSEMGKASGLAMGTLAKGLQEATKNALTLEEAMRATSMITSAGLDASMVDDFGAAAQKAAVALGRNTQDSLERFTRGVTKLEPELLDELGLFVRVDEAAEDYARTLGKSVSELTNFEKRQAFANATLEQAQQKFGAVNVPANPYDELAAAFADLSKQGLNLLNNVLTPIVKLLSGSTALLTGAMALFASTISGQVIGSLSSFAEKAKDVANSQKGLNMTSRQNLNFYNRSSVSLSNLSKSLKDGTAATYEYDKAVQGQNMSMISNLGHLNKGNITQAEYTARIKTATKAVNEIRGAEMRQRLSSAGLAESKTLAALQAGRYSVALKNLKRTMLFYRGALVAATKQQGLFAKSMAVVRVGMKATATAARLLTGALSVLFGPLSLIILAAGLAYEAYDALKEKFKTEEEKKLDEVLNGLNDTMKELKENFKEADRAFAGQSEKIFRLTDSYIAFGNSVSQVIDSATQIAETEAPKALEEQAKFLQENINNSARLRVIMRETFGTTIVKNLSNDLKEGVAQTMEFLRAQRALGMQVNSIKEAFSTAGKAADDFLNKLKPRTDVTQLGDALKALKSTVDSADVGADLDKIIEEGFNLNKGLKDIVENVEVPPSVVARQVEALEKDKANLLTGITMLQKQLHEATLKGDQQAIDANMAAILTYVDQFNKIQKDIQQKTQGSIANTQQQQLDIATELFEKEEKRIVLSDDRIKAAKEELNFQKARNDISVQGVEAVIAAENELNSAIAENVKKNAEFLRSLAGALKPGLVRNALIAEAVRLEAQHKTLVEQSTDEEENRVKVEKARLTVLQEVQKREKMILDLKERALKNSQSNIKSEETMLRFQKQMENRRKQSRGFDGALNAQDEFEIQEKLLAKRLKAALDDYNISKQKVELEFTLLEQQFALIIAETNLIAEKARAAKDFDTAYTFDTLAMDLETAKSGLADLKKGSLKSLENNFKATIASILSTYIAGLDKVYKEAIGQTQSDDVFQRVTGLKTLAEGFEKGDVALSTMVTGFKNGVTPMIEQLKSLGPEGEVIAAVSEGAFVMAESFATAGEMIAESTGKAGEGAAKTAAVLSAVGASLSAINNILQAQSQARIAQIDKEIEAEKKRDGKSAASIARISALEKKKDNEKRKAFETNKKMQMAMVVVNTAMAASAAIAAGAQAAIATGGVTLPAWVSAFVGLVTVLGAAQLALIAGTSYQGGGSIGGGSGQASSVSVGERKGAVDMAKSQGAAGEIGYFRGGKGIGGPENFTPAFAGYKNRAEGGNTAFMVGEQGPELFVPNRPGTIVPNDDVRPAGSPINANINISAVDAAGVEDVLMNQRGNIISMIREAANAQGNTFLEDINVAEL